MTPVTLDILIVGEWSNSNCRIYISKDYSIKINWLDGTNVKGNVEFFENFLILKYREYSRVVRIDSLTQNRLSITNISNEPGKKEEFKRTFFENGLIKDFKFDRIENLTITDIKNQLDI